jgi:hypothetical protein
MKGKKVNPFDKARSKDDERATLNTNKSIKPVAKDTNKTRRKVKKPTKGKII